MRGDISRAHELGKQLLFQAESVRERVPLLVTHYALGNVLCTLGESVLAREHYERSLALYDAQHDPALASLYGGADLKVMILSVAAWNLWMLGHPDQAREQSREAISWSHELSYPHSLAWELCFTAELHYFLRDREKAQEQADAAMTLSTEQGFPFWLERASITQGWAVAEQEQVEEGIARTRQGLAAYRTRGAKLWCPHFLSMLAETYKATGQLEEGLAQLTEALALVNKTGQQYYEAELYRLKGELTLQSSVQRLESSVTNPQSLTPSPQAEAEGYFLKAIEIAQKQQAKSLKLRATTSLARLWQQQGKTAEAHQMLSEIYNWFTEGFDTKDLQEAQVLLEELSD